MVSERERHLIYDESGFPIGEAIPIPDAENGEPPPEQAPASETPFGGVTPTTLKGP